MSAQPSIAPLPDPAATLSRTYDFEARLPELATMMSMSGFDYLSAVLRGEQPGAAIAHTLNFTLAEVAHGRAVFEGEPARFLYNPLASVHGGWAATLLDSAMGCAVHTVLPTGVGYTTLEIKVNIIKASARTRGRCVPRRA